MTMRRWERRGGAAIWAASLTALLTLGGCDNPAPSVSGSGQEATVKGVVKYKGKPVTEGTIRFDPANISRKDAKAVSAPIGKDGSYTLKTLVGGNSINVDLPAALTKGDPSLGMSSNNYDVPSGESTKDLDLGTPAP
jgi:hypothetical protein